MRNGEPKRVSLIFILLFCALLAMIVLPQAFAGGECNGNGNCSDTVLDSDVSLNGGDNVVSGDSSRSLALGNSLGDVDIAQCLGSTQWNTPLFGKQKLVLNWPCMAEFYLRNEKYGLAAMAICNTEVLKEFDNERKCEVSHNFTPTTNEIPITTNLVDDLISDIASLQARLSAYEARLTALEAQQTQDTEHREKAESRPVPRPKVIERTVVEQRPLLTLEQAASLRIEK